MARLLTILIALIASCAFGQPPTQIPLRVAPANTLQAIQAKLNAWGSNGRAIELPAGDITLPDTLVIPYRTGGLIYGQGAREALYNGSGHDAVRGGSTQFVYASTRVASEAAIRVEAQHFSMRDVSIHGGTREQIDGPDTLKNTGDDIAKLPVGLFIKRPTDTGGGLGTGRHKYENMVLEHCGIGIKSSDSLLSSNCDESKFEHIWFEYCDICYQSNNRQNLGHEFNGWHVGDPDVVFHYRAGGDMLCTHLFVPGPCTVLKIDPTSDGNGANSNKWTFYKIKIDDQAFTYDEGLVLVECEENEGAGNGGGTVVFYDVHFPVQDWRDRPILHLAPGMKVYFVNCTNLQPNLVEWTDGLFLFGDTTTPTGSVSDSDPWLYAPFVSIVNCTTYDQRFAGTSGTAQTGSSTTIRLAAGSSADNNSYVGLTVRIASGTGAGQLRDIASYNGTTKDATVSTAWTTNPDATSVYTVGVQEVTEYEDFCKTSTAEGPLRIHVNGVRNQLNGDAIPNTGLDDPDPDDGLDDAIVPGDLP